MLLKQKQRSRRCTGSPTSRSPAPTTTGNYSNDEVIERLRSWGISEIVLKMGGEGSLVADKSGVTHVPPVLFEEVVDTTAAGDSFKAGYLAARVGGASPFEAAEQGSRLAALVVQHRGAIMPRGTGE